MAGRSSHEAEIRTPTLLEMSQLAHMPWVPQEHDQFVTKGGWGRPVCVEYSAMSPGGHKWGMVSPGTVLIAKEVRVARMPSQCLVGGPPDWTIAIRCRSTHYHHRGEDCWVNITRGGQRFATPRFMPLRRGSTDDLRFGPLVGRGSWYPERWRRPDRPY